jgi:AcrR family transcriptional regulator
VDYFVQFMSGSGAASAPTYDEEMTGSGSGKNSSRLTARGAATRAHIVEVAADLMYKQGVAATTLDQVTEVGGISKSQLYHYFPNRDALVAAVIKLQTTRVFALQEPYLEQMNSLQTLAQWRDAIVAAYRTGSSPHGCLVGVFANELVSRSDNARILLSATFHTWQAYLASGFARMRENGQILATANPQDLATAVIVALEGGYLLAQTMGDARSLELALDMALDYIDSTVRVRD